MSGRFVLATAGPWPVFSIFQSGSITLIFLLFHNFSIASLFFLSIQGHTANAISILSFTSTPVTVYHGLSLHKSTQVR